MVYVADAVAEQLYEQGQLTPGSAIKLILPKPLAKRSSRTKRRTLNLTADQRRRYSEAAKQTYQIRLANGNPPVCRDGSHGRGWTYAEEAMLLKLRGSATEEEVRLALFKISKIRRTRRAITAHARFLTDDAWPPLGIGFQEFATRMGVNDKAALRWHRLGLLPARQVHKRQRVIVEAIPQFLADQPELYDYRRIKDPTWYALAATIYRADPILTMHQAMGYLGIAQALLKHLIHRPVDPLPYRYGANRQGAQTIQILFRRSHLDAFLRDHGEEIAAYLTQYPRQSRIPRRR